MSKLSDRLAEAKRNLGISTRAMSERAEANGYRLSNYSASVYTNGRHPVSADPDTLDALAFVLRIPRTEVRQLAGLPVDLGEFQAHESANMLTAPQRTAVNEIIRLLAEGNMKAGDGDAEATPLTRAGVSPAPEDDGLGSFGGRARGDLDHESVNDGAGDNVHRLRPDLENMAAYRTGKETEKQRLLREEAERENESQDPDDWE